jgi:HlyD family secretion protein
MMTRQTRKRVLLIAVGVLVLAAVVYGFLPDAVPVQTAIVERGPLQVLVEEEGETRLDRRHVISSPVSAYARAIRLEVGDRVALGQALVELEPPRAAILDPRARTEAAGRVEAARASLRQAEIELESARLERERLDRLLAGGAATPQALEQATSREARATAAREAARAELAAAQSALQAVDRGTTRLPVQETLRAPTAGRVLAVHHRSDGHVNPAQPLIEIGDTDRLEVEVDVLSRDAVRIQPGTRVLLDDWGDGQVLEGVVDRVAPQGFTAVSALGVEERRVPVIARLVSSPAEWARLGAGYRVLARFIVWEGENVLQVPTSALFRTADGWATFVVAAGRAERRAVTIGQQAGLRTQVVDGLVEGERVVVHPPNELDHGDRVRVDG